MPLRPRILVCQCRQAGILPADVVSGILNGLTRAGISCDAVDDLCGLAAQQAPLLNELSGDPLKIAACHPRAVKWLFSAAHVSLNPEATELLNLRAMGTEDALRSLLRKEISPNLPQREATPTTGRDAPDPARSAGTKSAKISPPSGWRPWFPVIDFDRCTDCMQCLSFCLFGVFGVDHDRRIEVQNPQACKTNCPACSRVCPETAIIFPKHEAGPINGDVVQEGRAEAMKANISALLGGDVYGSLRDRNTQARNRFSQERSPEQALNERRHCLAELIREGFIPAEVLNSLPSPEEIQRRAAEAAARAQALTTEAAQPAAPGNREAT